MPAPLATIGGVAVPELLARIRDGDRDALALLYTELLHTLWTIAVLQTGVEETAEEIVHDVFLNLWTRRETIRPDLDIRVYLAAAVRNRARDLARHHRRAEAVAARVRIGEEEMPAFSRSVAAADATFDAQEFSESVARALASLSERERTAALLRWEERMTFEQIARVLSLSNVGVRKIVLRAQAKVLALLGIGPRS